MKVLYELKITVFQDRDTYLGHGFQTTCLPQVSSIREAEFREARAERGKRGLETLCISELQKLFKVGEPFFFLLYFCFPLFFPTLHPHPPPPNTLTHIRGYEKSRETQALPHTYRYKPHKSGYRTGALLHQSSIQTPTVPYFPFLPSQLNPAWVVQ